MRAVCLLLMEASLFWQCVTTGLCSMQALASKLMCVLCVLLDEARGAGMPLCISLW